MRDLKTALLIERMERMERSAVPQFHPAQASAALAAASGAVLHLVANEQCRVYLRCGDGILCAAERANGAATAPGGRAADAVLHLTLPGRDLAGQWHAPCVDLPVEGVHVAGESGWVTLRANVPVYVRCLPAPPAGWRQWLARGVCCFRHFRRVCASTGIDLKFLQMK